MDDFNCCLAQIVHLCLEANLFLNQLYKFHTQLTKFYSSDRLPTRKYFLILKRFTIILNDLNLYHQKYFFKVYSHILHYLTRDYFTIDHVDEELDDFYNDLNHLNYFLHHQQNYSQPIVDYLHQLSIICLLCIQYRHLCTHVELAERFVHIRIDLLINLKGLNKEIQNLLAEMNFHFHQRTQIPRKANYYTKEKILIANLSRTICLWLILIFFIGYYLVWSNVDENKPRNDWSM